VVESWAVPDWNEFCGEIFPPRVNDMPTFESSRELECNLEEEELMCTNLLVRVKLHILCCPLHVSHVHREESAGGREKKVNSRERSSS
jgi:hypothetical protein